MSHGFGYREPGVIHMRNIVVLCLITSLGHSNVFWSNPCDFFIRADVNVYVQPPWPSPDVLQYDDESAYWLTWSGMYRGTHFQAEEFCSYQLGCEVQGLEFWFYHHPDYPWDTSSFYAELWTGDLWGPVFQDGEDSLIATHYAPVTTSYSPPIWSEESGFWGLVNTEMSAGGWPSLLSDNTPNFLGQARSFYSEDMIIWEPWSPGASCSFLLSTESASWGWIKGLFR